MKTFLRIVAAVLALILLVGLVAVLSLFTSIPWLTDFMRGMTETYGWLSLAISILLVFFIVLTLAFLLFVCLFPKKQQQYATKTNGGRLEISRQCIESGAGITLQSIPAIKRYLVQVKGKPSPGKLKLKILTEVRPVPDLVALGQEIQSRVTAEMEQSLALAPEHIVVQVDPYVSQDQPTHGKRPPRTR